METKVVQKVIFRVDASEDIGSGHAVRCQTLARELCDRGMECIFVCRDLKGNMIERFRHRGFNVMVLPQHGDTSIAAASELDQPPAPKHSKWLGTDWLSDANETIAAFADNAPPEWLVVDHYALDYRWESRMRPYAKRIMVIDDLADRKHDCDLLLDQTLLTDMEERYDDLVPCRCARLLGPQYALLQPEYVSLRPRAPPRLNQIRRVLVFFGGVDQHNVTGLAVSAFLALGRSDVVLDVVLSSQCPHAAAVREQAGGHTNVVVHESFPSLAPLILSADLALGAGGATSLERCCLGLPSLVITIADNQKHIAAELDRRKLIQWLGHHDAVTLQALVQALKHVIEKPEIESWSRQCMKVVDGNGTSRVASLLELESSTPLVVRLAQLRDEALLLRWANDPLVRTKSFTSDPILAETHRRWFYRRLRNTDCCRIYVVETEQKSLPIGQVRFDRVIAKDDTWEIGYSIDSVARGRGLGTQMLDEAIRELCRNEKHASLLGRVKVHNMPSQAAFDRLGFTKQLEDGRLVYRRSF
jgi:UDP-2,4-diacetamido-2,4,6-trideoxy-beta-L-altropyranose hydrolase